MERMLQADTRHTDCYLWGQGEVAVSGERIMPQRAYYEVPTCEHTFSEVIVL